MRNARIARFASLVALMATLVMTAGAAAQGVGPTECDAA
jgi:hypothetical protein